MITYWELDRRMALYHFYDSICTRLVIMASNHVIDMADYYDYYAYYDMARFRLASDAVINLYIHDL